MEYNGFDITFSNVGFSYDTQENVLKEFGENALAIREKSIEK